MSTAVAPRCAVRAQPRGPRRVTAAHDKPCRAGPRVPLCGWRDQQCSRRSRAPWGTGHAVGLRPRRLALHAHVPLRAALRRAQGLEHVRASVRCNEIGAANAPPGREPRAAAAACSTPEGGAGSRRALIRRRCGRQLRVLRLQRAFRNRHSGGRPQPGNGRLPVSARGTKWRHASPTLKQTHRFCRLSRV